jgi:leader peptidase (prepilin peptidase) / N-methyltransferase
MTLTRQVSAAEAILPLNGRAMETPAKKNRIADGVFAAAGSAAVLASLFAAPGREGIFGAALALLMTAAAAIDARSFILPDSLTFSAFSLGLARAASEGSGAIWEDIADAAWRGLLLALAFYLLRAAYFHLRRRQGIGLGDVKLAAAAGAWLDWALIPAAIEIAALAALAAYALRQFVTKQSFDRAAKLPFGLFFAPAIWLSWFAAALLS